MLDHADIAIGSRFVNQPKGASLRMFGSNIIQSAIKLTTGETINDPTSGMRAFNARMIKLLALGLNMGPEPDTVSYLIRSLMPMLLKCRSRWPSARRGRAT